MSAVVTSIDKFPWTTDAHVLQFPNDLVAAEFVSSVRNACESLPGSPFVSAGDLGWQNQRERPFEFIHNTLAGLETPVWFVRGNHDRHPSDIEHSNQFIEVTSRFRDINGVVIQLNPRTSLVGEDGAPDYRSNGPDIEDNGTFRNTKELSYPELFGFDRSQWAQNVYGAARLLQGVADKATERILRNLERAFETSEHAVLVTHYPPYRSSAWHNGVMGTPEQCSGIINQKLGEELEAMLSSTRYSNRSLTVLCGHTHEAHEFFALPNLRVLVGQGNRSSSDTKVLPKVNVLEIPA